MIILCLILTLSLVDAVPVPAVGQCRIQTNNNSFPTPDPLILKTSATSGYTDAFYLPQDSAGTITFESGEQIRLSCPGDNNFLNVTGRKESIISCENGTNFKVDGKIVDFSKLNCAKYPFHYTRGNGTCNQGRSTAVEIGFYGNENEFFSLLSVCFDKDGLETVYSRETLPWQIVGHQHGTPRPGFFESEFYPDVDANEQYKFETQLDTFTRVLGSSDLAENYLQQDEERFLARGHFSPRGDFIFGSHTRASFYFINVGPQWQNFNGNEWERLENQTRTFVIDKRSQFEVYTGPYGILELMDVNNNLIPIYLADTRIPAPRLYYKVVYEPATQSGVVVLGVNNPYLDDPLPDEYILCPDVCDQIKWYKQEKGMYCCEVDSFRSNFPGLPNFETRHLLTG